MPSSQTRGLMLVLAGVFVISPDALLIRLVAADSLTLLFWRGLLTAIGLLLGQIVIHRGQTIAALRSIGCRGLVASAVRALGMVLFVMSIRHTTVANTLIILGLTPLWGALLSRIVLGEHIHLRTWIAIPAAMCGVVVTVWGGHEVVRVGDVFALCASITLAGYVVLVRSAKDVDMTPSLIFSGLLVALCVSPLAAPASVVGSDIVYLGILGLLVLPISFGLIVAAPRHIPAPEVNLVMLLEMVLGPYWVWLVLGEAPPPQAVIGGAIVIVTLAAHTARSLKTGNRKAGNHPSTALGTGSEHRGSGGL